MDISELKPGLHVVGILPGEVVEIVAVTPSANAVNVFYLKLDGTPGTVVLFPEDCLGLRVSEGGDRRTFSADPRGFLLAAEALRIRYSYVFDTRLAMHTSIIEPLPHQITAVYEEMLHKDPLRFLLADDPGAGKTIMAGLLIKELMIRGDVERCLIVCPGGLVQQWVEDEMGPKFGLEFRMLTNDVIDSTRSGNPFVDLPLLVASVDKLARDDRMQRMIEDARWDLVIVDEAHKMAAHVNGRKVDTTRRYRLGRLLSRRTRHMLLMTATPHNGREADFQEFMKLLDVDLFEGGARSDVEVDLSAVMRRLQKEELLTFEGKPLFPIREARKVQVSLTAAEQALYDHVTAYVREGFNRAERIVSKDKRNAVGFAMTSLQRRLASSPLAAYRSLHRRRLRLEERANEVRERGTYTIGNAKWEPDDWDWDEWDADDREDEQDTPVRRSLAWRSIDDEADALELTRAARNEASKKLSAAQDRAKRLVLGAYRHLLCPSQDVGDLRSIEWDVIPIPGTDGISKRAFARADKDEILLTEYSPYLLDRDLSTMLLRDKDSISCSELADDYARYCYLRRFSDMSVLRDAIARGVESKDYFAYADGRDSEGGRYLGLKLGERPVVDMRSGLVVRREKALEQLAFNPSVNPPQPEPGPGPVPGPGPTPGPTPTPGPEPGPVDPPKPRLHDVELEMPLDRLSAGMQVGTVVEEILQQLYDLSGASADLTFEAYVHVADGINERTVSVIRENANALGVTLRVH